MKPKAFGQRRIWQRRVLALCWIAYALSYLCRTNLSIALPQMTQELGWSASKAGMIGSAFFISYGAGHLLNGLLGDKLPIKRFMTLGLLGTSLCNLLIGIFPCGSSTACFSPRFGGLSSGQLQYGTPLGNETFRR